LTLHLAPLPEIFDTAWTPEQLRVLAEESLRVQGHLAYRDAARLLACNVSRVDHTRIRRLVVSVMGGNAGTHYIVAALQAAHLALSVPQLFTERQAELLTAPLAAALKSEVPGPESLVAA
jgi:arginine/ornithine N-succinyltransferase beta subunit